MSETRNNEREPLAESGKGRKLVGLFLAAALAALPGCGGGLDDECYDGNEDGYCDDGSGATTGSYYIRNGKKIYYKKSGGLTSGTKSYGTSGSLSGSGGVVSSSGSGSAGPKGGIGSSSGSAGG